MPLPMVAIVGRPNVGKSSLLNMMAGRRISIVDPTAGVTRDRIKALVEHNDVYFEVVDTGGFGIVDRDDLSEHVEQQIRYAVLEASLVLFVVDARQGLVPLDQRMTEWLRSSGKPVILLANKADAPNTLTDIGDFNRFGFGEPMLVSATHGRGRDELKDRIVRALGPLAQGQAPEEPVMKLALVGRRNVGKSTFINALAGQDRVIVSEIPGTTRDAVDVRFERDGHTYLAIDTAGLRKKNKFADDIEYYGFHRAELSIRRADVVLFLMEATSDVSQVDKRLASYIAEQYKPCILVVNKWDLVKRQASSDDFGQYLLKTLPGLDYAPVAFTTASQSRNVQAVTDLATSLFKQARTRVGTSELNQAVEAATRKDMPKARTGTGAVKVYYATQVATCPPTIVFFVNAPARVSHPFERYLSHQLHELLPFTEVPIRLVFRGRQSAEFKQGRDHVGTGKPSRERQGSDKHSRNPKGAEPAAKRRQGPGKPEAGKLNNHLGETPVPQAGEMPDPKAGEAPAPKAVRGES